MGTNEDDFLVDETTDHSNRRLRRVVGVFASILLFCIIVSIELSTLDLNFASFVYGSDQVWQGHRASFRIYFITVCLPKIRTFGFEKTCSCSYN